MGKMIEQIRIGKTSKSLQAQSSKARFGPDLLITIPARGFSKCRISKALQKTAIDHTPKGSKPSCTTGGNHSRLSALRPSPVAKALRYIFLLHVMVVFRIGHPGGCGGQRLNARGVAAFKRRERERAGESVCPGLNRAFATNGPNDWFGPFTFPRPVNAVGLSIWSGTVTGRRAVCCKRVS